MCVCVFERRSVCVCLREEDRESVCVCYRSVQPCCWMSALPSSLESLPASSSIIIVLYPLDCVASYCSALHQPSVCVCVDTYA